MHIYIDPILMKILLFKQRVSWFSPFRKQKGRIFVKEDVWSNVYIIFLQHDCFLSGNLFELILLVFKVQGGSKTHNEFRLAKSRFKWMPVLLHFYLKHHDIHFYITLFSKFVQIYCPDISESKFQFPDKKNLFACLASSN